MPRSSLPSSVSARINSALDSRPFRAILAIFGGYAFAAGFFAFLSVALYAAGVSRVEAMWWGVLTSFLIYTIVILWAAASNRPARTALLIIGGAALMIGLSEPFVLQLNAEDV